MKRRSMLGAVLALAFAGCATTPEGQARERDRYNLITAEQIAEATQSNVLQLVRELRPSWRGTAYLDGYRLGSMSELASIPVSSIREVEYLEPIEAAARFGIENEGGAILVKSR